MPPSPRSRRNGADRDAQARAAWLALIDQLTNGQPGARRTWTGDELLVALCAFGDTGQSVVALTGRLNASASAAPRAREQVDVERFGMVHFTPETTPAGRSVVAFPTVSGQVWLTPAALTYLPCPASPADGVFVLTVADPVTAPPGQKLPAPAYLQEADGAGQRPRWVAGGLVLAKHGSAVETGILAAPDEVWFDFPALVRWVGRTLGTPPPRTTAEGLDDPALFDTLVEALARHRATAGAARQGAKATQGDVDAIARAAIAIGLQPTVAMLTRVLGRGSASTLHPLLKSFYSRAVSEGLLPGAEAVPVHDVPPAFLTLLDQLRAAVRAEAEAALAPQRAALAEREAAAAAREAALAADQSALVKEREELATVEKERTRYVSHLEAQLAEAIRERQEARDIAAGHEALIHRLEAEAAAARMQQADVAARTAAELDQLREERAALAASERAQLQTIARLESERDSLQAARQDLADRLAQAGRDAAAEREAAERRLATAQAAAEARWQASHQQTVDALDSARLQCDTVTRKMGALQSAFDEKREALAVALAERQAAQEERERLAALLGRLTDAPTPSIASGTDEQ
ncbi:Plasmid replication region DNA-binding N-term [Rhodanobacter denitrificans]|uniref:Plasmid replication region DNA-binding N-term n=1 Tax=Rhodanobacter denitrificans TaxID=666685 RepID=M4NN74_9GAMM|nr:Plasmid replication region DNA-binding N-term [Rhodanobacter denitrificans]